MSGRYLLDTNIIIALFAEEQNILDKILNAAEIYIPTMALGEMYYGAYHSQRIQENILKFKEFEIETDILTCNAQTAYVYGKIKAALKKKSTKIPENDIWIASLALENDLILVSRDKHFEHIDTLKLEKW
ncbi:MAG: type II toxin-antitoxin system VapC family toxin [Microscillaceae bacterium]|nr:type II toxin-antitoxin system VapC family toxin [Microscillaceae bacterium]